MERYLRHDLIDWFDQEHLRATRALVIGAGAVGNEVVKNLALLGVGAITIVDFDKIELHNLTRSVLFSEDDVGKYKAEVAADAVKKLDPNCCVEFLIGDIWDAVDFSRLRNSTVVFSCVDGFIARIRINQLCSLLGVDLINSGIDSRYVSAEIFPFMRDPEVACYECNLPPSVYQRVGERFSCGWLKKVAFEEKKVPTTAITASYAGALATSLFLYSFREDAASGARRVFLDSVAHTSSSISLSKSPMCACCAGQAKERVIIRANRRIDDLLLDGMASLRSSIMVSDPILVSWETPIDFNCEEGREVIFALASHFSDADATCRRCGLKHRLAVIRDQFTVEELAEFRGMKLPGKFASIEEDGTQILVELYDGDEHE
ncbi:ThiF family adenylyltransferase [Dyella nitratireducens]|uniref:ThiF family adenylyltransferase n=1 Tax=Dyella nitratireducens TaxID=1849580 RepID=UPI00166A4649|nr:ThiF family adenylyltransferase [Dyella nitratireducens]